MVTSHFTFEVKSSFDVVTRHETAGHHALRGLELFAWLGYRLQRRHGDFRTYNQAALHDFLARDLASLIHPQHDPAVHRAGRVWVRGDGAMLIDADGKEYIDGLAGLWNVVLGHGRRELAEAAREQMETLGYASGYAAARTRERSSWPSGLRS